jgi:hypothetical protein
MTNNALVSSVIVLKVKALSSHKRYRYRSNSYKSNSYKSDSYLSIVVHKPAYSARVSCDGKHITG